MKNTEKSPKQYLVLPGGIESDEYRDSFMQPVLSEFDIQLTADSENVYPAIAQGFPTSGTKDVIKEDLFK